MRVVACPLLSDQSRWYEWFLPVIEPSVRRHDINSDGSNALVYVIGWMAVVFGINSARIINRKE